MPELYKIESTANFVPDNGSIVTFVTQEASGKLVVKARKADGSIVTLSGDSDTGGVQLAKVTEFIPHRAAFSGVTEVVVSGLGVIGDTEYDWTMDASIYNGTYRVTPETEFLTGYDRVYQHTTDSNLYIRGYDSSADEWSELESGWSIQRGTGTPSYWGDNLYYAGATIPVGENTWANYEYGNATVTTTATSVTTPEQLLVLNGVQVTSYNRPHRTYTYGDSLTFSGYEQTPKLGQIYVFEIGTEDPVTHVSALYLVGNAIDLDYNLIPVQDTDHDTILHLPLYTEEAVSKISYAFIRALRDTDNDPNTDPVELKYFRDPTLDTSTAYAWTSGNLSVFTSTSEPTTQDSCYTNSGLTTGQAEILEYTSLTLKRRFGLDKATYDETNDVTIYAYAWEHMPSYALVYTNSETPTLSDMCYSDELLSTDEAHILDVFIGDPSKCLLDRSYYNRLVTSTKPETEYISAMRLRSYPPSSIFLYAIAVAGGVSFSEAQLRVYPVNTEFNIGTKDFCIEFYICPLGYLTDSQIITFGNLAIRIGHQSADNRLRLVLNGSIYDDISAVYLAPMRYHQIAVFRHDGVMGCYIDGNYYAVTHANAATVTLTPGYSGYISICENTYGTGVLLSNLRISNVVRYGQNVLPAFDNVPAIPTHDLIFYDPLTTLENWIGYNSGSVLLRTSASGRTFQNLFYNTCLHLNDNVVHERVVPDTRLAEDQPLLGSDYWAVHTDWFGGRILYSIIPLTGSFSFWACYGSTNPGPEYRYGIGIGGLSHYSWSIVYHETGQTVITDSGSTFINELNIGLVQNRPAIAIDGEVFAPEVDLYTDYGILIGGSDYQRWYHHVVTIEPYTKQPDIVDANGIILRKGLISQVKISYYVDTHLVWSIITGHIPYILVDNRILSSSYVPTEPPEESHIEYHDYIEWGNTLYMHHPLSGNQVGFAYADIRIYDAILTIEEIKALYANRTV